jgi:hypothetical protein
MFRAPQWAAFALAEGLPNELYMSFCAKYAGIVGKLLWMASVAGLICAGRVSAAEETFPVLQVGTRTYTNVTITTKAKTYVFIMHSAGMASLKLSELPPELLEQLGYAAPEKPKTKTEVASSWAKDKLGMANIDKVNAAELKARDAWTERSGQVARAVVALDRKLCGAILAVLILLYVFNCRCCAEICKKVGKPAGIMAWLPGFLIFPLLQAAGMSLWWFLGYLLGPVGLVVHIVWSFKIATARGKGGLTGFFLALPLTSFFAFIYLAFSDGGAAAEKPERRNSSIMTLETA